MFLNYTKKKYNSMDKINRFKINEEIKFHIKIIDYVSIINHNIITVIKK